MKITEIFMSVGLVSMKIKENGEREKLIYALKHEENQ